MGREIRVGEGDDLLALLGAGAMGRLPETEMDGASLLALAARGQAVEERVSGADRLFEIDHAPRLAGVSLRENRLGDAAALEGTAVVDQQEVPGLVFASRAQPVELADLPIQEAFAEGVIVRPEDALVLSVQGDDDREMDRTRPAGERPLRAGQLDDHPGRDRPTLGLALDDGLQQVEVVAAVHPEQELVAEPQHPVELSRAAEIELGRQAPEQPRGRPLVDLIATDPVVDLHGFPLVEGVPFQEPCHVGPPLSGAWGHRKASECDEPDPIVTAGCPTNMHGCRDANQGCE